MIFIDSIEYKISEVERERDAVLHLIEQEKAGWPAIHNAHPEALASWKGRLEGLNFALRVIREGQRDEK